MKRVEGAIRSLLGLTVVEEALGHTRRVSADLNKQVRKTAGDQKDLRSSVRPVGRSWKNNCRSLRRQVQEARETRLKLEDLEEEADRKLSDALRKGNREELEKERDKPRFAAKRRRREMLHKRPVIMPTCSGAN